MSAQDLAIEIVANADGIERDKAKIDINTIIQIITTVMALFEDCNLSPQQMAERAMQMALKDLVQLNMGLRDSGFFGRRRRRMANSIQDCCERHSQDEIQGAIEELSGWSFL